MRTLGSEEEEKVGKIREFEGKVEAGRIRGFEEEEKVEMRAEAGRIEEFEEEE